MDCPICCANGFESEVKMLDMSIGRIVPVLWDDMMPKYIWCKYCGLLKYKENSTYYPSDDIELMRKFKLRQDCKVCGAPIVHPDRKWQVCLDCLIDTIREGDEIPLRYRREEPA